jgi:hypothetical protein
VKKLIEATKDFLEPTEAFLIKRYPALIYVPVAPGNGASPTPEPSGVMSQGDARVTRLRKGRRAKKL